MRIFIASGYSYWEDFTPDDLGGDDKQIGGGETAMVHIAQGLARLGHQVTVFYDVARPGSYSGVDYLPTDLFVPLVCQMEHDILISWDNPHLFRFADRALVRILAFQLNHANVGVFDHTIDRYFHPSEWHLERFTGLYPEMIKDKCRARMTNGIDPNRYVKEVERNPLRVIHSSSPDRGLHHLLRMWSSVIESVPEAELHIFYDMDKWIETDKLMEQQGLPNATRERAREIEAFRDNGVSGVTFHGGVGQGQLAIEQLKSGVMVYPCDPVQPTEGFSMTCLEAVTAGCQLITSDADALKELWADAPGVTVLPLPVDDNVWIDTITRALTSTDEQPPLVDKELTWTAISKRWEQELLECLKNTQP
jgi:glycosyltransferase involved in cell wall biosynthesis